MPTDNEDWGLTLESYRGRLRKEAKVRARGGAIGPTDVSDLVQETYLKALTKEDQHRGTSPGELWVWLRAILLNLIRDLVRRKNVPIVGNPRSLDQPQDDSSARRGPEPVSDVSTPSQKCVKKEEISLMLEAMQELPEDQRTAFRMKHMEGLSVREIAQRMDRPLDTVPPLLYRGMKSLREKLGQGTIDGERRPDQHRA
jgi:RNA polymerase sigma-70 factor (ECF subfamily)